MAEELLSAPKDERAVLDSEQFYQSSQGSFACG